jgi:hypothetical protein
MYGSGYEAEDMKSSFWAAFWAGLAAPTMLYAPVSSYYPVLNGMSVATSFAAVGFTLDHSVGAYVNVRPIPTGQSATAAASASSIT